MPKRPVRKRLEHRKKSKPKENVRPKVSTSADTGEAEAGTAQQSGNIIDNSQINEKQCEISSSLEESLPSTATDNNTLEVTSVTSISVEEESLSNIATFQLDNSQGTVPSSVSSISLEVQSPDEVNTQSQEQTSEVNAGDTFADSLSQVRLSTEVPMGGMPFTSSPKHVKMDPKDQLVSLDEQVPEMECSLSASTMKSPPVVRPSPAAPENVSCTGIRQVRENQQNTNPQWLTCQCVVEVGNLPNRLMSYLMKRVPKQWGVRVSDEGAYVMLFSLGITSALQRVVYASFDGNDIQFIVHNNILPSSHEVYQSSLLKPRVPLSSNSVEAFATVLLSGLHAIQDFKMCLAIDNPKFVEQWPKHPNCRLDENSFHEETYEKTLRTADCELLVARNKKRCKPCAGDLHNMNRREARRSDKINPNTRHQIR